MRDKYKCVHRIFNKLADANKAWADCGGVLVKLRDGRYLREINYYSISIAPKAIYYDSTAGYMRYSKAEAAKELRAMGNSSWTKLLKPLKGHGSWGITTKRKTKKQ